LLGDFDELAVVESGGLERLDLGVDQGHVNLRRVEGKVKNRSMGAILGAVQHLRD
jgi:hypothetical protein